MELPQAIDIAVFSSNAIKGLYGKQITPFLIHAIVLSFLEQNGPGKYLLAHDMRTASAALLPAVQRALQSLNCKFEYIGQASLDLVSFATSKGGFEGAIWLGSDIASAQVTGVKFFAKHSAPIDHNTFKNIAAADETQVNFNDLPALEISKEHQFHKDYFFEALKAVDPMSWRQMRIVIDGGNGMGGELIRKLCRKIPQIEPVLLFTEPNEYFPHHLPNPGAQDNLRLLTAKVKEQSADLGISLSLDGTYAAFVGPDGNSVHPAFINALIAEIELERNPGAKIGYNNKQIYAVENAIFNNNGHNIPLNNDSYQYLNTARELQLEIAVNSNGTIYYQDIFYTPSPFYTLLLLLEKINKSNQTLPELVSKYSEQFQASEPMTFLLAQGTDYDKLKYALEDMLPDAFPEEKDGLVMAEENFRISLNFINSQFVEICLETLSDLLLHELTYRIMTRLQDFGIFSHGICSELDLECLSFDDKDRFEGLLSNLWFTWNPHFIMPIIDMYGDGWRKNVPPEALVANYGKERLNQILSEKHWELTQNVRLFKDYFARPSRFETTYKNDPRFLKLEKNPIAYFCMEYGLVDWLQIYSGGLGVLAGDYMKQTSDMGIPVVGVGLFYHQGYLHQDFGPDGGQVEDYIHQEPMDFNMELVKDAEGKTIIIEIPLEQRIVKVRAWRQKLGRNQLLLLDTNFEENAEWEDRLITGYLYGGDLENRIRQELVLGIAGARLIDKMGIKPSIYHMNEGHSGFLVLECTRSIMQEQKLSFDDALKLADNKLVFTNHTLKPAGNDIFDFLLFERYLKPYANEMKVSIDKLFELGDDKTYSQGGFSMTVFGFKHAKVSNAVSILHSKAAAKIWSDFPLVPVTNGVHMPTWVSPEIHTLLDDYLGEDWHYATKDMDYSLIQKIPKRELWEAHRTRKYKLIHSLNNELGLKLDPEVLTIAWSRRLAQYKRPDLMIADIERLKQILTMHGKPVQILIAGKSHPKDTIGKQILQKMNQCFADDFFNNKIEIVPGYNWQLARRMVSGADIWLNTPYRYEEACGTSGMKAAANGVIQLTTLDGWTDEVDWFKIGWVIPEEQPAESLYGLLQNDIIPLYYNKNEQGFNEDWVNMALNSIQLSLERYSAERMVKDYLDKVYSQIL